VAARLSVRTTAACRLFPLGEALPSTTSAGSCLPLFGRFLGTMASSDFSSACMFGVRHLPSRAGPALVRARMRPPRFRAKNFPTCTRSPTARGSSHASQYAMGDVAFSSSERDRHLGIGPVSQLNTWPVFSPVNASRRPSRDAAHHSGSGWLARPSPWGTFTSYSLPASWRTPSWVKNSPPPQRSHVSFCRERTLRRRTSVWHCPDQYGHPALRLRSAISCAIASLPSFSRRSSCSRARSFKWVHRGGHDRLSGTGPCDRGFI
jgi:hypothetical protein